MTTPESPRAARSPIVRDARSVSGAADGRAGARSKIRAVAVPNEHGGWGITGEPVLLGLLIDPSVAGACVGLAAVIAFLARAPLRVLLVDSHRGRSMERTRVARTVFGVELVAGLSLVALAGSRTALHAWWPAVVAAPLVGVQLAYDARSRSRRLAPELAGSIGIGAVAAVIILSGGGGEGLAAAVWMILAARAVTAIVTVRDQVGRSHGRPGHAGHRAAADAAAAALAVMAGFVDPAVTLGSVSVGLAIGAQRLLDRGEVPRPVVLGLRQTALGLGVVLATALGAR